MIGADVYVGRLVLFTIWADIPWTAPFGLPSLAHAIGTGYSFMWVASAWPIRYLGSF